MEELKGLLIAINALGEKIDQLMTEVKVERYYKEENKAKVDALEAENAKLNKMLESVHQYIAKMEE
jgi:hypothetical protein